MPLPIEPERKQYDRLKQAAALRYDQEKDPVPRVVAKGKGEMAERIIQIAKEHDIEVYEDPDMIEMLSKLDVSEVIPDKLFMAVAEVLAYVYRINNRTDEVLRASPVRR